MATWHKTKSVGLNCAFERRDALWDVVSVGVPLGILTALHRGRLNASGATFTAHINPSPPSALSAQVQGMDGSGPTSQSLPF